jgi:hypothetical protein
MSKPITESLRRDVLNWFVQRGSTGGTDEECQKGMNMKHQVQTPRRWELMHGGCVEDSGQTRLTETDSPAIVWVATGKSYFSVNWADVCRRIQPGGKKQLLAQIETLTRELAKLRARVAELETN